MNINKWMVFCKEFDFNNQFHQKDLISVYQTATKFKSTMTLPEFLTAVTILREKYLNKFHQGDNFVSDVLKINSDAAFRFKMANRKIKYSQPTKNFFEQVTYPEPLRFDDAQK